MNVLSPGNHQCEKWLVAIYGFNCCVILSIYALSQISSTVFAYNNSTFIIIKHMCMHTKVLINFNGMSIYLGLFWGYKLGNCVHYTFIFTFFV